MKFLNVIKEIFLFIWQLPQNLIGLFLRLTASSSAEFTNNNGEKVKVYYTKAMMGAGVSLGKFIYFDPIFRMQSEKDMINDVSHECGHQVQSKIFGPAYLLIIGLPSATSNIVDRIAHTKWTYQERITWYYNQPWEKSADKFGKVER